MSPEHPVRSGGAAALLLLTTTAAGLLALTVPSLAGGTRATGVRATAAGPSVQAMVVGQDGSILSPARTVLASGASVPASGRSCAVAAATPLAALADLHAQGGPGFLVRDYGHCGAATRSSAELFVYSLGGEANRGADGWVYKVGHVAGTTGAGDPSGAMGNGQLLRSGQRVLWFWCDAQAGGCQRTLEVSAADTVSRHSRITVRVTGYENEGRGAPVAGAIVSLGSDFASTASSGQATLLAPASPGLYKLSATRRGMVPSFPQAVQVR